jgi:hypothetical protein
VIISMVIMANGLSLVTSPSTDAIMGTLNRDKAVLAQPSTTSVVKSVEH